MTPPATAVSPTAGQRWRSGRWVILALIAVVAVATVGTLLTA
jgi:hypothetical protein